MNLAQLWTQHEQALLWSEGPVNRAEVARLQAAIEAEVRATVEQEIAAAKPPKRNPCADLQKRFDAYRAAVQEAGTALERADQVAGGLGGG